jgi:hypothetical protein
VAGICVEHVVEPLVVALGQLGTDQGVEDLLAQPLAGMSTSVVAVVVESGLKPLTHGALCRSGARGQSELQTE